MSTSPLIFLSNPPHLLGRTRTTPLSPLNPNRFGTSPVQINQPIMDKDSQDSQIEKGYYESSSPSEPLTSPTPAHPSNHAHLYSTPHIRYQISPSRLPSPSTPITGHSLASSSANRLYRNRDPSSSTQRLQTNRPQPRWSSSAAYQRTHEALMASSSSRTGPCSMNGNEGNTIKSAMWRDKFRQRCLKRHERRKMGLEGKDSESSNGVGSDGEQHDDDDDDEEAEREDEEIFRRIMTMQRRRAIHATQASYDREVGSDPAVWESEVREAEEGDEDIPPDMALAIEDEGLWAMMEEEEAAAVAAAVEQEQRQRLVMERETMDGLLDGIDADMLFDEDVEMGG